MKRKGHEMKKDSQVTANDGKSHMLSSISLFSSFISSLEDLQYENER